MQYKAFYKQSYFYINSFYTLIHSLLGKTLSQLYNQFFVTAPLLLLSLSLFGQLPPGGGLVALAH